MTGINWIERAEKLDLRIQNWVEEAHVAAGGAGLLSKLGARDGQLLYELKVGDPADADRAVASARSAFADGRWSRLPLGRRKEVLLKLADLVEQNREELALLECLDVGKPISNALAGDVSNAAGSLRYFAEAADKLFGVAGTAEPGHSFGFQLRKPVGVVGAIVGWNFPLSLAALKVGPALVTGNTLVLKPSEFTSLSAVRLAELASEAGVPAGVFNVVHGAGATVGAALARHPDVRLLSFTGSSATGKRLMISAGESNMKRLQLECGGKSPYIVFDDCPDDLDFIARDIVETAFPNQGELCAAGTRLLVQEGVKDTLLPKVLERAAGIRAQDPLDPATTYGALINEGHLKKVLGYIENGREEGARLIHAGKRVHPVEGGYYLEPSIFDRVEPGHRIAREEIFGPVLSVFTFKDEEEAYRIANDSSFGLAAYACTTNLGRAQRLAQGLDAGTIIILGANRAPGGAVELGNDPHKESGFGAEGGMAGLAAYTVKSSVHVLT